jgi:plastocyanin
MGAALVTILAGLAAAACSASSPPTLAPNVPGAAVVVLRNIAFNPPELTVSVGTTVDWKWEDHGIAHNVMSVGPGPLDSPLQATGDYDYRFTKPGVYQYHCSVHTYMVGTITVRAQ